MQSPDNRSLDTPRLYIPASTPTAFVRFETAIAMVSLESGKISAYLFVSHAHCRPSRGDPAQRHEQERIYRCWMRGYSHHEPKDRWTRATSDAGNWGLAIGGRTRYNSRAVSIAGAMGHGPGSSQRGPNSHGCGQVQDRATCLLRGSQRCERIHTSATGLTRRIPCHSVFHGRRSQALISKRLRR